MSRCGLARRAGLAFAALAVAGVGGLAGCALDGLARKCSSAGGSLETKDYVYSTQDGGSRTGNVAMCVDPEGAIIGVYNPMVRDESLTRSPSEGTISDLNLAILSGCSGKGGVTYSTKYNGKSRFVCFVKGQYLQILS